MEALQFFMTFAEKGGTVAILAFLALALWWMNEERKAALACIEKERALYKELEKRYMDESRDNKEVLKEIKSMWERVLEERLRGT